MTAGIRLMRHTIHHSIAKIEMLDVADLGGLLNKYEKRGSRRLALRIDAPHSAR